MANLATLEQYLIDSTLLDSPVISADPTFFQIKSGLSLVIQQAVKDTGYTVETLPSQLENYVLLLAKKEIYFRLATLTAPEYNMETEFSKLLKGNRWEHYYKLLEVTLKEIKRLEDEGIVTSIDVGDLVITGRNGSQRNYRLATSYAGNLSISNVTPTTVDISWLKFLGSEFAGYDIMIGTSPIYDEYEEEQINQANIDKRVKVTDVQRSNYRMKSLTPNTLHYLVFTYLHTNGYKDRYTTSFTTLDVI